MAAVILQGDAFTYAISWGLKCHPLLRRVMQSTRYYAAPASDTFNYKQIKVMAAHTHTHTLRAHTPSNNSSSGSARGICNSSHDRDSKTYLLQSIFLDLYLCISSILIIGLLCPPRQLSLLTIYPSQIGEILTFWDHHTLQSIYEKFPKRNRKEQKKAEKRVSLKLTLFIYLLRGRLSQLHT